MAKSSPRILFGVHSFTAYNRSSFEAYGSINVLKGSSFNISGELVELNAGSAKFPWAIEDSTVTAELNIKGAEYPDFLFELFMGKKPTSNVAEASGSVTVLDNKAGSLVEAATGIASIGIKTGSEGDLKFGKYYLKAISATTVHAYAYSDVDFGVGNIGKFYDDEGRITDTPLTIATGAAVEIPNFGLEITGGTGTIAMNDGDTATFDVRTANQKSTDVIIGATTDIFPTFGAIVTGQKRGTDEIIELDIFALKAIGLPLGFEEKAYSDYDITAKASYDSERGGVFSMRHIVK